MWFVTTEILPISLPVQSSASVNTVVYRLFYGITLCCKIRETNTTASFYRNPPELNATLYHEKTLVYGIQIKTRQRMCLANYLQAYKVYGLNPYVSIFVSCVINDTLRLYSDSFPITFSDETDALFHEHEWLTERFSCFCLHLQPYEYSIFWECTAHFNSILIQEIKTCIIMYPSDLICFFICLNLFLNFKYMFYHRNNLSN